MNKYLFIVVPNKSGSTFLQNCISHCFNAISFQCKSRPNGIEGRAIAGHSLYPEDRKLGLPHIWSEKADSYKNLKWDKIKKKWNNAWNQHPRFKQIKNKVFIEKTPQNVLTAQEIQEHFENSLDLLIIG
jgi:hypothetical protein